jgi:cytosine/uracil/thiamine/allantoin permease
MRLVVWISPWAGITLADFFLLRGGRVDVASLYAPHATCRYGDVNGAGMWALGLGVAAAWSCQMGTIELTQGSIALALGGIDLSWLAGTLVGGASYLVLQRRNQPREVMGEADTLVVPTTHDVTVS